MEAYLTGAIDSSKRVEAVLASDLMLPDDSGAATAEGTLEPAAKRARLDGAAVAGMEACSVACAGFVYTIYLRSLAWKGSIIVVGMVGMMGHPEITCRPDLSSRRSSQLHVSVRHLG